MEQAIYWLWFAGLFGRGPGFPMRCWSFTARPRRYFRPRSRELRQTALLNRGQIDRVLRHDTDAAQRQYDEALQEGCRVLTPGIASTPTACGTSTRRPLPCLYGAAWPGWRNSRPLLWWVPATAMNTA